MSYEIVKKVILSLGAGTLEMDVKSNPIQGGWGEGRDALNQKKVSRENKKCFGKIGKVPSGERSKQSNGE